MEKARVIEKAQMNWEKVIGCVEILLEAGDEGPALMSACPSHPFPREEERLGYWQELYPIDH